MKITTEMILPLLGKPAAPASPDGHSDLPDFMPFVVQDAATELDLKSLHSVEANVTDGSSDPSASLDEQVGMRVDAEPSIEAPKPILDQISRMAFSPDTTVESEPKSEDLPDFTSFKVDKVDTIVSGREMTPLPVKDVGAVPIPVVEQIKPQKLPLKIDVKYEQTNIVPSYNDASSDIAKTEVFDPRLFNLPARSLAVPQKIETHTFAQKLPVEGLFALNSDHKGPPSDPMSGVLINTVAETSVKQVVSQVQPSPMIREISTQIIEQVKPTKSGSVELQLSPKELGSVSIRLVPNDSGMVITISAERSETIEIMRRHGDVLLQEFKQAGFSSETMLAFGGERGRGAEAADRQETNKDGFEPNIQSEPSPSQTTVRASSRLNLVL